MITIDKKIKGNLPISLISDNTQRMFNVSMEYPGEGKIYTWYSFPIMVKEKTAREQYNKLTK